MKQSIGWLILLLVASVSSAPNQPEQQVPNSEVPYQLVSAQANGVQAQPGNVQVVNQAPVVQPAVVSAPVSVGEPVVAAPQVVSTEAQVIPGVQQQPPQQQQQAPVQPQHVHHQAVPSYYNAPAGLVTVVGNEQQVGPNANQNKPVGVSSVRNYDQYGQPEPAALPPNYKPFGSWGLYIGGNPADGYYTNYYKALSNSVDKQQTGEPVKPVVSGSSGVVGSQTAALSPFLRQASSSPYVGNDYYSFAYSPAELNSVGRIEPVHPVPSGQVVSPVQAGAQVYGAPASYESSYGVSPYADAFVTKKVGAAKELPLVSAAPKGYQSRVYVYPSVVSGPLASPVQVQQVVAASPQQQQQQQQQQLVAYPVPVGSQIVGSQPGVDGAFNPYGVHAFTRYAVKPTLLSPEQSYLVQNNQQLPVYKQQVYVPTQNQAAASYYPYGSYYGYPLSQLHYSQGSVGPSVHHEHSAVHHGPVQPNQFEAASDKSESEIYDKLQVNKQQKRA